MENGFIDILLFGYRIASIKNSNKNTKLCPIFHPLPEKYTLKFSGKCFEIKELKYNLVETNEDIYYEMDFEYLLRQLK